jgi:hypothetical protein
MNKRSVRVRWKYNYEDADAACLVGVQGRFRDAYWAIGLMMEAAQHL